MKQTKSLAGKATTFNVMSHTLGQRTEVACGHIIGSCSIIPRHIGITHWHLTLISSFLVEKHTTYLQNEDKPHKSDQRNICSSIVITRPWCLLYLSKLCFQFANH